MCSIIQGSSTTDPFATEWSFLHSTGGPVYVKCWWKLSASIRVRYAKDPGENRARANLNARENARSAAQRVISGCALKLKYKSAIQLSKNLYARVSFVSNSNYASRDRSSDHINRDILLFFFFKGLPSSEESNERTYIVEQDWMKKVSSYKLRRRKVLHYFVYDRLYRLLIPRASRFVVFTNSRSEMHLRCYRIDLRQEDAQTYWNIDITLCRSIFTADLPKMTSESKYRSSHRWKRSFSVR